MKKLLLIFTIFPFLIFSQNWVDMMQDPSNNFYQTQSTFNSFWEGKAIEKERDGSNLKDGKTLSSKEYTLMGFYSLKFCLKKDKDLII